MKNRIKKTVAALAIISGAVVSSAGLAHAGAVCLDVGGATYVLGGLPKKPKVFAGYIAVENIPFVASGFVDASGNRVIGISEMWSTGGYEPVGTVLVTLPPNATSGTYKRSYSGLAAGPNTDSGTANIITCP